MKRRNQGYVLALVLVVTLLLSSVASLLTVSVVRNIQTGSNSFAEESRTIEDEGKLERYHARLLHCGNHTLNLDVPAQTDKYLRYLLLHPTVSVFPDDLPDIALNTPYSESELGIELTVLSAAQYPSPSDQFFVYELTVQASESVSETLEIRFSYTPESEGSTDYVFALLSVD